MFFIVATNGSSLPARVVVGGCRIFHVEVGIKLFNFPLIPLSPGGGGWVLDFSS